VATLENVENELAQRIRGMQTDAGNRGLVLVVTTGYRSLDDQWRLYNDMVEAKKKYGKKWQKYAALAAYPGTSDHGRNPATAVDLACAAPTKENIAKHGVLATKWGLARTVASEYWHLQLARTRSPIPAGAPTPEDDDVPDKTTDACIAPSGRGRWILDRDGAVRTYNFNDADPVPFHGSLYDYPKEQQVPGRYFVAIQPVGPTDGEGYWIISNDGGAFKLKKTR
jgi:LAS superfamily LD-carboxypeptidase LdcB